MTSGGAACSPSWGSAAARPARGRRGPPARRRAPPPPAGFRRPRPPPSPGGRLGRRGRGPLPGVSRVAMQEGRHVARTILRATRGEPRQPFHYVDKGSMATIGRSRAVAQIGALRLHGLPAWLTWLFVHLWYLIGFRNR